MPIGLFDTETPLLALREQILERLTEVVERGVYILGPEVTAFEQEFAAYLGVRHVIGVANGTDAITIALKALGVVPTTRSSCRRSRFTPRLRQSSRRCATGLLRRRPGDPKRHRRDRARGADAPD